MAGKRKEVALVEVLMDTVSVMALVVMLTLIGVQSARALTSLSDARSERLIAEVRADLTDVAERQVLYYLDEAHFAPSAKALDFVGREGVVMHLKSTRAGWSATASHAELDEGQGCAVFFGAVHVPAGPVQPPTAGQVACTE